MAQHSRRFSIYVLEQSAPFIGFLASMAVLTLIVMGLGEDPAKAFAGIYKFALSDPAKLAAGLSISIPYYLSGLSIVIAFRAGVFNIGNEGQYFIGGMVGAIAGVYFHLPPVIHIPVVIIFSMLGGALWALIPAVLKAVRGIHEVITTIMFNNIALALVNFLVNGPLSGLQKGTSLEPQMKKILPSAHFGKLNGFFRAIGWNVPDYVYLDYSLIVAIVMGLFVWFLLFRTRQGFEIRAVGTSTDVSRYAGIPVSKVQIGAFMLSGAIAGLIGLQEIFAIRGFYTYNLASGLGFDGIAISLIGKNSPVGIVFSSALFAFLKQAGYGLQLYSKVPNSVTYAIQGIMILFIVTINEILVRAARNLRKKEVG
ncbi:MAG TPA: ABC transporter permease [Spirochaetia bacterium]|nr:ABC transporter permease [Spirochaetia bacterium]